MTGKPLQFAPSVVMFLIFRLIRESEEELMTQHRLPVADSLKG